MEPTITEEIYIISDIMKKMGLENLDIGYIFIGMTAVILILIILEIIQIIQTNKMKKRMNKFMLGRDGKSLEKDIVGLYEDNKFLRNSADKNKQDIRQLYKNMELTFQKMGLVRYDAFRQMGGQLSFSLALLNENNDGFIINSVHSTDGCYSYTKEIKKGESAISLSEEEKQALEKAMGEKL